MLTSSRSFTKHKAVSQLTVRRRNGSLAHGSPRGMTRLHIAALPPWSGNQRRMGGTPLTYSGLPPITMKRTLSGFPIIVDRPKTPIIVDRPKTPVIVDRPKTPVISDRTPALGVSGVIDPRGPALRAMREPDPRTQGSSAQRAKGERSQAPGPPKVRHLDSIKGEPVAARAAEHHVAAGAATDHVIGRPGDHRIAAATGIDGQLHVLRQCRSINVIVAIWVRSISIEPASRNSSTRSPDRSEITNSSSSSEPLNSSLSVPLRPSTMSSPSPGFQMNRSSTGAQGRRVVPPAAVDDQRSGLGEAVGVDVILDACVAITAITSGQSVQSELPGRRAKTSSSAPCRVSFFCSQRN
jgi:hypothetical protein